MLIVACTLSCSFVALANEDQTDSTEIEYSYAAFPDEFNPNVSFHDIEIGIFDFISKRNLNIELGSEEYVELMYDFLYGEISNIEEVTERYFGDYASVYVAKVQENLDPIPSSRTTERYNIDLPGTIEETKQANMERINALKNSATNSPTTRSSNFDLSRAQAYAEEYALSWNYVYGRYSSDCTNFASQILHYAGMPLVSGQWQYNGNELAKRRWNVAHDFIDYFGLERGYAYNAYATRAEVNTYARPGDFMGYMSDDTYTIWHVVFVQSKVNGEIYVSQHTTDRFNERWNSINITRPSTYFINRFT